MSVVYLQFIILAYFTFRFSGITKESLKSVKTTLRDVQAVLLSIFNNKSILIGHSLESDFIALKVISFFYWFYI